MAQCGGSWGHIRPEQGDGVVCATGLGLFSPWVRLSAASSLINSSLPWRDLEAQGAAGALFNLSGWSMQDGRASERGMRVGACVCVCTGARGMLGAGTVSFLLFKRSLEDRSAEMRVYLWLPCTDLVASYSPGKVPMSTCAGAAASGAFRPLEGSTSPGVQFIVGCAQQPLLASSSVPCPRSCKMLRGRGRLECRFKSAKARDPSHSHSRNIHGAPNTCWVQG